MIVTRYVVADCRRLVAGIDHDHMLYIARPGNILFGHSSRFRWIRVPICLVFLFLMDKSRDSQGKDPFNDRAERKLVSRDHQSVTEILSTLGRPRLTDLQPIELTSPPFYPRFVDSIELTATWSRAIVAKNLAINAKFFLFRYVRGKTDDNERAKVR